MTIILSLYDSSFGSGASLMKEGKIIAAIEEERLNRIKHSGGFPFLSVKSVLNLAQVKASDVDYITMGDINHYFLRAGSQLVFKNNTNLNPLLSRNNREILRLHRNYISMVDK